MLGKTGCVYPDEDSDFEPFIADAIVSLVGYYKRFPIKLLRDTGAKHSFVLRSVLLQRVITCK